MIVSLVKTIIAQVFYLIGPQAERQAPSPLGLTLSLKSSQLEGFYRDLGEGKSTSGDPYVYWSN